MLYCCLGLSYFKIKLVNKIKDKVRMFLEFGDRNYFRLAHLFNVLSYILGYRVH